MRCACQIKLTFSRGLLDHRVRRLFMSLVSCRACFGAEHHYVVEFSVLLSECFGLRWCSLHTHEQANASFRSHTTRHFFSREGLRIPQTGLITNQSWLRGCGICWRCDSDGRGIGGSPWQRWTLRTVWHHTGSL